MKPINSNEVFENLKNLFSKNKIDLQNIFVLSIIAGKNISQIQKGISFNDIYPQIIRVIPNTPALLSEEAIGYVFSDNVLAENKEIAKRILSSIGFIYEVDEKNMDDITALSGSGQAYIFYLEEAMIKSGIEMGLNKEISEKLVIQTIFGSAKML